MANRFDYGYSRWLRGADAANFLRSLPPQRFQIAPGYNRSPCRLHPAHCLALSHLYGANLSANSSETEGLSSARMTFSSTVAAKASAKAGPDRRAMLSRLLFRYVLKQTRRWLTAPLSGAQPSTKFIHPTVKTTSLVCAGRSKGCD